MRLMRSRTRLATLILTVTTAIVAGACTSGETSGGKAGGLGEPLVLRMANTSGHVSYHPAVEYFVDRVEELSGGDVRIEVVDHWGDFASDAEQQVVRDVSTGAVDLGWVGTRVFDTMGVESFRALTAPMLIDSYALEDAVIESGMTDQMLRGLDDLGVVGLGVLADGLRKPVAVAAPLLGPTDWRDIGFGTLKSESQAEAIRALQATPAQVFGTDRDHALESGTIQGYEMNLWAYQQNGMQRVVPYVTTNVDLWPQMDVLLANQDRLQALTDEQREWIRQAAEDAEARSAALADTDAHTLRAACDAGARFADASQADLSALLQAFAPAYANLQKDPETNAYIERIQAMKRSTSAGPALVIPTDCTGPAPEEPTLDTGAAPAYLNGTYRYVITLDEAQKAGMVDPEDTYPQVTTVTLKDGRVDGGCFGAGGGTYSVKDDRITFDSAEFGYTTTVSFARDRNGSLHLTPVSPIDAGDLFVCFSQVWTKIA